MPRAASALTVLGLTACASSGPATTAVVPEPTLVKNYDLDVPQSAGIGDPIFDVQTAVIVPAYEVIESHDPGGSLLVRMPDLEPGTLWRAASRREDGSLILRSDAERFWSLLVKPNGIVIGYTDGEHVVGDWPDTPLLHPVTRLEGQERAFRAQLIYSGLDSETLRATYREFAGDFIRPASSQELQYDISEDSTIAYKTIRIRVLEATNSQVRYVVVDDGALKWLLMAAP